MSPTPIPANQSTLEVPLSAETPVRRQHWQTVPLIRTSISPPPAAEQAQVQETEPAMVYFPPQPFLTSGSSGSSVSSVAVAPTVGAVAAPTVDQQATTTLVTVTKPAATPAAASPA